MFDNCTAPVFAKTLHGFISAYGHNAFLEAITKLVAAPSLHEIPIGKMTKLRAMPL